LGSVGTLKGGDGFELGETEILTQAGNLLPSQVVISSVRIPRVAVHTLFKTASIQANICKH